MEEVKYKYCTPVETSNGVEYDLYRTLGGESQYHGRHRSIDQCIKTLKTGAYRKGASEYVYLNHPYWTQDDQSRASLKRLLASAEDHSDWNMGLITVTSLKTFFTRAA